ncbi:MAG: VOC family protein [Desulfomonilaceae bacterium]
MNISSHSRDPHENRRRGVRLLVGSFVFSVAVVLGLLLFGTHGAQSQTQVPTTVSAPPRVDHILLTVSDMKASVTFYRDMIGLRAKSLSPGFSILEAENLGVYLTTSRRSWEPQQGKGEHLGLGMYPHFEVGNVKALVDRLKKAGYKIVQEAQVHDWGTEAFVADPDGYTWALFSWRKKH